MTTASSTSVPGQSLNTVLKATPLSDNHRQRGAKMVPFAGFEMPLQYDKVLDEHMAVRNLSGLFDISHMGILRIDAPTPDEARDFLDHMVPNDLSKGKPGKAFYTQLLNEQGGIIDDIIVYQLPEEPVSLPLGGPSDYFVIVNASNTDVDADWLAQFAPPTIQISDVSNQFGLLALQGPLFDQVLLKLNPSLRKDLLPKRFCTAPAVLADVPVVLARTGYTGEDGVEIIVSADDANQLWDTLLQFGASLGLKPIGLGARDTLRLEAAYPLHGHDINDQTSPLEAGLAWSVKLKKETDFIGKEALVAQVAKNEIGETTARRAICLELSPGSIPRQHDVVLINEQPVGEITSGSISPVLGCPIAMALVSTSEPLAPGDSVSIQIRKKTVIASVVPRPFYKPSDK